MKFDTDDLSLACILYVLAFGAGQNVSLKIADLIGLDPLGQSNWIISALGRLDFCKD